MANIEPLVIASPPKSELPKTPASISSAENVLLDNDLKPSLPPTQIEKDHSQLPVVGGKLRSFFGSDVEEESEIGRAEFEQKKRKLPSTIPLKKFDLGEAPIERPETEKEAPENKQQAQHDEFSPIKRQKVPIVVKEEPTDSVDEVVKRRRGRPKKNERVPKEMTVTRKSSRIVDKADTSSIAKSNAAAGAKPLRVMHFDQLLTPTENTDSPQSSRNLPFDEHNHQNTGEVSLHQRQGIRRNRNGLPNTLDVLLQFVKETNAKPKMNDTVNEAMILSEYKLHLVSSLEHLRDLHLDILDISNEIYEVQRKKNEVRRKVLEIKKEHATTLESIDVVANEYDSILKTHLEFMDLVVSLQDLKKAIDSETPKETLEEQNTREMLNAYSKFVDPKWGFARRLRVVNTKISSMLADTDEEE